VTDHDHPLLVEMPPLGGAFPETGPVDQSPADRLLAAIVDGCKPCEDKELDTIANDPPLACRIIGLGWRGMLEVYQYNQRKHGFQIPEVLPASVLDINNPDAPFTPFTMGVLRMMNRNRLDGVTAAIEATTWQQRRDTVSDSIDGLAVGVHLAQRLTGTAREHNHLGPVLPQLDNTRYGQPGTSDPAMLRSVLGAAREGCVDCEHYYVNTIACDPMLTTHLATIGHAYLCHQTEPLTADTHYLKITQVSDQRLASLSVVTANVWRALAAGDYRRAYDLTSTAKHHDQTVMVGEFVVIVAEAVRRKAAGE